MKHELKRVGVTLAVAALATCAALAQEVYVGPQVQQDVGRGNGATDETTCAANYTYGDDLVAGWNDANQGQWLTGYATSNDGGASWVAGVVRPPSANRTTLECDPFAIYDPRSGAIWAGGLAYGGNGGLYIAKKVPGAHSYEAPVMVFVGTTDKPWGAVGPDITDNSRDMFYVAHQQGCSRSSDGVTWQRTPLGSGIGFLPRVGPTGVLYICYWDFGSGVMLKKSTDNGASFTTIRIATRMDVWGTQDGSRAPGNFRVPSLNYLAVDPINGHLHCVYFDTTNQQSNGANLDLYYCKSTDEGNTWSTPRVINQDAPLPGDQFWPWLEVDRAGRIGILFFDSRNVAQNDTTQYGWFDQYYQFSDDGGATWSEARLTPNSWSSQYDGQGGGFCGDYSGMSVSNGRMVTSYLTGQNLAPDIYGNTIISPYIVPFNVTLKEGSSATGNADDAARNDARRFVGVQKAPISAAQPSVDVWSDLVCGSSTASRIDGRLVLSCSGAPSSNVIQTISLWNYSSGQWDPVLTGPPSIGDAVYTFAVTSGAGNYIGPRRAMRVRTAWYDRNVLSAGWDGKINEIRLKVAP